MKVTVGNRIKLFDGSTKEEVENAVNEFMKQFDGEDGVIGYCYAYAMGGLRIMVSYPILKEQPTND